MQCNTIFSVKSILTYSTCREAHTSIIDGAALVNVLKPAMSETFDDDASMLMEHTRRQFVGSVCRVDITLDVYKSDSLKTEDLTASRRRKRGRGTRSELKVERSYMHTGQSSCERMTTRQNYFTC